MKSSRVKNSFYNVSATLVEYFLKLVLVFITRTIFIKKLGSDYLGLEGLFTNIIQILSITELGLGSAITFSLYKPLFEKNYNKINLLMKVFKKCYFVIGLIIAVIGLIIIPFLPIIINSSVDFGNVYLIFFLYILQTLSTYWFLAYNEILLNADQKQYKAFMVNNIIIVIKFIMQLISLIVYESFLMFIISTIISNLLRNYLITRLVRKNYSYLNIKNDYKLDDDEKSTLVKNVVGMSMYRISSTVMNSTDNIIISIFISLNITGIYSNYLLIVSNLKLVLNTLFTSMTSSVGNLYAEGNKEKNELVFRRLSFLNFWFFGIASICLWCLLNDFIELWIGKDYIFDISIVFVIVLNFITDGLQRTVLIYKDACGLFWKGKLRPVFSAITNIVLSLVLVKYMGIFGVILASIISRFITTWWFDPYLVYKNIFNKSPMSYYLKYFEYLLVVVLTAFFTKYILGFIVLNQMYTLLLKGVLCVIISCVIFCVLYSKTTEFKYFKVLLLNKTKGVTNK